MEKEKEEQEVERKSLRRKTPSGLMRSRGVWCVQVECVYGARAEARRVKVLLVYAYQFVECSGVVEELFS